MTAHTNQTHARFGYVSGLDGLRLVAVAIVIAAHYQLVPYIPGGFGVSIFFFISGFLITRLMLAEEKAYGQIALGRFYVRRFIRLLPPLALMGIVAVPLLALTDPAGFSWSQVLLSFSYLGNVHKIGSRLLGWNAGYDALEPLWSLAVEEHFYLLLPPVLLLVRGSAGRIRMISAVLAGALVLRMLVWAATPRFADDINYNFTLTRIDAIGWGVLLTLLLDAGRIGQAWIERHAAVLLWGGALAMLLSLIHWSGFYETAFKYTPQSIAIGAAFCGAIFPARNAWVRRIAELPAIRYLGKTSYELYLWHYPVYSLAERFVVSPHLRAVLSLAATIAISSLAYSLTTRRLAPLRKRFGGHPV
ncbi:MAG: acyltransferase [Novosphingobium sp.]|uniref:acyltransferase family protein n=1 Tax=Novosphingobium sp. TaxID=1874826 RepID=UPI0012C5FF46|nr:acyltransferase [Novosphingobium sp.]MPS68105.1 acyltransferase [Novosphingobium sp.]